MKRSIYFFSYILLLTVVFASCKKDIGYLQLNPDNPNLPKLTASENTITLQESRAENTAVIFEWTKPSFNFSGAFDYTIQLDTAGSNFSNPVEVPAGSDLSYAYNEKDLNDAIKSLGVASNSTAIIEVRVEAFLNDSVPVLYSTPITLSITTYGPTDQYIFVPGAYQGWNPPTADTLRSKDIDNMYEGYVYYPDANSLEFKFTDAPDWNHGIYGDGGDGTTGLIVSPGNNMKVTTPGYYRLNADLVASTWTNTKTDWGLIGSATPSGWDSDQNMSYSQASKTWTITVDLIVGEMKFRANDDWAINFGDDGANGSLEYDGANIAISEAGNYTVTLNLHSPWNYTYSLKKN